ncbi:putative DNA recombination protein RecA [Bacillus phage BCD7]|uniref:Putative DNA recombination protein RecA n=1 Tax=Bacillus phage BCD7 TaxID=1136534 RepID=J9PVA1_9CAUD|nr:putative DNA recombination protein RecA [Bacillus phage BCD7]AEZ50495.1 putative DNA recombination protein RecA [Bacillus phage BCD7]
MNILRKASDIKAENTIRVSTGSIGLDIAIGGGYPVGRFIQVAGAFSASKSSTVYHGIREFQNTTMVVDGKKVPLQVALIQGENASFTMEYAEQIGIDTERLILSESGGMEESLEVAYQLQVNGIAQLIVFDSLASLVPTKERDSEMDESVQMGLKPKLFDEYFRKFQAANNILSRKGLFPCTVIGINQIREKIGVMHGNPEFTPGGRAIGFTASLDIYLKRGEWIKTGTGVNTQIIGQQVRFKINKSKVSVPFRTGEWDFYNDEGGVVPKGHIDNFKEIVIEGIAYGVTEKSGNWISYGDVKVNGENAFVQALRERPDLYEQLKAETMKVALSAHEEELAGIKESNPELLEYDEGVDAGELAKAEEITEKLAKEAEAKATAKAKKASTAKKSTAKKTGGRKKATA